MKMWDKLKAYNLIGCMPLVINKKTLESTQLSQVLYP